MKSTKMNLIKYEAENGKVFDWLEPHYIEDENGKVIREHLYAKVLYIGDYDSITNYIEVSYLPLED